MRVPVVYVRVVRVLMHHWGVDVPMRVRLGHVGPDLMVVLVMLVVAVRMAVGQGLVDVLVLVPLAQM